MFFKRLGRFFADLLDIIGRLNTAWDLIKFTSVGHILAAGFAGLATLWIAIWRSDPIMSGFIFAIVVAAVVFVLFTVVESIGKRPKLKYGGIAGMEHEFGSANFGSEQGGYMWGESFLRPLLVRVSNIQQALDITANNVRASIEYEHFDNHDKITTPAVWLMQGRHGVEAPQRIQIDSGEMRHLVLVFEYPETSNLQAPGAKRTNDYLATGNLFEGSHYKKLRAGHWKVFIDIRSDNCAPLWLKGGFTITREEKIKFDAPALRKVGAWS